jgi:hypothetical protein
MKATLTILSQCSLALGAPRPRRPRRARLRLLLQARGSYRTRFQFHLGHLPLEKDSVNVYILVAKT